MPRRSILPQLGLAALVMLLSFGCAQPPPPPLTADELRVARQAMPLADVSLMLRSGYKQPSIIAEIERRHVSEAPDAAAELNLVNAGATAQLIQAVKSKENLLSPQQKQAFDEHRGQTAERVQQEAARHREELYAQQREQENDRARRQHLFQQTVNNSRAAESREQSYHRNAAAHKATKQALEQRITYLQAEINRKRSNGFRENELIAENQTLERYNQELRQLPEPQLR